MQLRILLIIGIPFVLLPTEMVAQEKINPRKNVVAQLMDAHQDLFSDVLADPAKYDLQILYTQIDRDEQNQPTFTQHAYRVNATQYFYPASTVKLPAVLLALEKLSQLNVPGLTKYTPLRIDSAYARQTRVETDSTAQNGLPSIAHYIKKILLVSDNDAYNRLYEFIGQQRMNEALREKGFTHARIITRLSVGSTPDENRCTNPFTFYQSDSVIYQQPLVCNTKEFLNRLKTTTKGRGFMRNDSLIRQPMDFSKTNAVSIEDLQGMLRAVLFPEVTPAKQRFYLTDDDYTFLYKYLSMLPRESDYPSYQDTTHYDSYVKFFMYGDSKAPLPDHIRIFNKVGWAYGYVTDNAYVVDFENNVEFLLTATILANEDGIFNDDKYEYETVGLPFLANLGRVVYEYELKRKRRQPPDLQKFRMTYQ